ncbi:hypothetical protein Tco_1447607 [Tanacetum coccineum]
MYLLSNKVVRDCHRVMGWGVMGKRWVWSIVNKSKTSGPVKRGQDTKISQSSGSPIKVSDEVVHKELGDRMERAATTASSLEAEQDSGVTRTINTPSILPWRGKDTHLSHKYKRQKDKPNQSHHLLSQASEEDKFSDPEQDQRDKDMPEKFGFSLQSNSRKSTNLTNKNLSTIHQTPETECGYYSKVQNDNSAGNIWESGRAVMVVGLEIIVGGSSSVTVWRYSVLMQGICGHYAKGCRKPKRVKDYHVTTRKDVDVYMANDQGRFLMQTQATGPFEPLEQNQHQKDSKAIKKANATLVSRIKLECKIILAETSRSLREFNIIRDSFLVALQNKQTEFVRYKAFNDRTVDYDKLEPPKCPTFNGRPTFANPMYLKKAQYEKPCLYAIPHDQSDPANRLVPDKEEILTLKEESRSKLNKDLVKLLTTHDLKYIESLEDEIDELESDKAEFSNMYDMLLQECVSNDIMCSYLQSSSDLDEITELQCLYLNKVKECDCLAQKLSEQTKFVDSKNLLDRVSSSKRRSLIQSIRFTKLASSQLPCNVQETTRETRMAGKGCALHHWVHDVVFNVSNQHCDSDSICIDPVSA